MELRFTYYGLLPSANRKARVGNGRAFKPQNVERAENRLATMAWAETQRVGWDYTTVEAYTLEIVAYNSRKDLGNIEKVIGDAMLGIVYDNDKKCVGLAIQPELDHEGERYDILIRKCKPLVRRARPRKLRFEDLTEADKSILLLGDPDAELIGPVPATEPLIPMRAIHAPATWRRRVEKERLSAAS